MKLPSMNDNDLTTPADAPSTPDGAHQLPIGAGATDLDGFTDEGPKKSGSSAIVLVALVIVSGAVLWGMRHLGTRGSINLVDISIDYPIRDDASTNNSAEVIKALHDSAIIPQVEPQMVAVNPFTWRAAPKTEVDHAPEVDREAERLRKAHEQRMRALDSSARNLRVQSVMRGRVPIANISGELVAVGDTVAGQFKVTRIDGREVDVEAEGRSWTLTVGGN